MSTAYGNSQSDIRLVEKLEITTTELIASTAAYDVGTVISTTGYTTAGDGGGGQWVKTATTGTPSQSPAQLVDALLNDGSGKQWALVATAATVEAEVNIEALGGLGDNSTDILLPFNAWAASTSTVLRFGAGQFKTTGELLVGIKFKRIVGAGRKSTKIKSSLATGNMVKFAPAAPSGGSEFLADCAISDLTITSSVTSTLAVGLYLEQCASFEFSRVTIDTTQRCLVIAGGQLNQFSNFILSASGNTASTIANAGIMEFIPTLKSDAVTYQNPFTCEVSNFSLGGAFLAESGIYITAADGINFSTAYMGNMKTNTINFDVNAVNSNLVVVNFTNVYLDGINSSTGTLTAIRTSSGSSKSAAHITFSNFFIGNYVDNGAVLNTDVGSFKFSSGAIANINNWGINAVMDTTSTLTVCDVDISNVGTTAAKGAILVSTSETTKISNVRVSGVTGAGSAAFKFAGNHEQVNISDSTVRNSDTDLINNIGTGDFTQSNNMSLATTKNMGGMSVQNKNVVDASLLDWYEEYDFTPTITFGGAAVGVTYITQTGRATRIGRVVQFSLQINLSSKGSSTGNLLIEGLPTVALSLFDPSLSVRLADLNATTQDYGIYGMQPLGSTTVRLDKGNAAGALVQLDDADLKDTSVLTVSGSYQVAS